MEHPTKGFNELLTELRDILGPVLAQRERLGELCEQIIAILEPPRQPKQSLDRIGNLAEKLDPPWVLTQDQRIHVARVLNPTQVMWPQLENAIQALGPMESVLSELRRIKKSVKKLNRSDAA